MTAFKFLLLCLITCIPLGCTEPAKTPVHLASNQVASALSWIDARTADEFEVRSEAKLQELEASGGTKLDYDMWLEEDGFLEKSERIKRAFQAHALLVSYLDGKKLDKEVLQLALIDLSEFLELSIAELESHGVKVPVYVKEAVPYVPVLAQVVK